ncbi:hypothetical protein OO015_09850 [Thermomicrobium sp. 4228-Ro]|uniref:ArnT family glycosyltransferase n=1 Tax=Thermomicrobium sp. 4228-Ro TaxID=2993937 RepID=UPI002248F62E|nr:hypothetical protein [Thermomicrobium sp. 4228-Ro]MCX2727789.1 hypothetical protein [Thermomicrobium sp. 4228-Ro]
MESIGLRIDPRWLRACLPLLLAGSVVVASLLLNRTVFQGVPHTEDEIAFLFQAATLARGHLVAPAPPVPDAFAIPFVIVRDGMWFGKYPPGYPLVLALGVLVGYPPIVNALSAGFCVLLVVALAHRVYDFPSGLLAAILLATSPFFLLQAASFMAHTVCLLLTLVFLYSFAATLRQPSLVRAFPGAGTAAILVLARPLTAVGVLLPFAVWSLWRLWRCPTWRPIALCYAAGGLLGSIGLLAYNRLTTGNPFLFGYELWWPFDKVGFGSGISPDGKHTLAEGILNTRSNIQLLEEVLYGWPGRLDLLPALLGIVVAAIRLALHPLRQVARSHAVPLDSAFDLALAAQVTTLIAVHVAYWTPGQMYGPRYYFEALGAIVLLSARGLLAVAAGIRWLWRVVTLRHDVPEPLVASGSIILVALVGWGLFVTGIPWWRSYSGWYDIHAEPARTVAAQAPPHSLVLLPVSYWTEYAPFFVRNSPLLDSSVLFAQDLGPRNTEILAAFPDRVVVRYSGGTFTPLQIGNVYPFTDDTRTGLAAGLTGWVRSPRVREKLPHLQKVER